MGDKEERRKIKEIAFILRDIGEYKQPTIQSVGGIWTADTYVYEDIYLQIMDSGYTRKIENDYLNVYINYAEEVVYIKGSVNDLHRLHDQLVVHGNRSRL